MTGWPDGDGPAAWAQDGDVPAAWTQDGDAPAAWTPDGDVPAAWAQDRNAPAGLPVPHRTRWQPLRTGLVDIFYYDYQEFWFRDGRLMLRGNNGTGKSKVLALTLPLLLDADLSPTRVEPDGDRAKKMDWNLLLGGKYDERLGYTWLEFGRRTDDGEHAYFTIGCGLKAVAGRGIADRWYFTTSQRVGADLYLIGPNGTVLTRDRLTAAVGEYGMVTQRADTYRRAVDEHLMHLGPDRYGSLIDLLIQLRQPQLSKRPDEGKLSRALSEALAPVDQSVLADIATAFHDLEQQRDELAALKDTRGHVARFGQRYQHYASAATSQASETRSQPLAQPSRRPRTTSKPSRVSWLSLALSARNWPGVQSLPALTTRSGSLPRQRRLQRKRRQAKPTQNGPVVSEPSVTSPRSGRPAGHVSWSRTPPRRRAKRRHLLGSSATMPG